MEKTISIIGGDSRIVSLAEVLALDKYKVYTYGLEKAKFQNMEALKNIIQCTTLKEALSKSKKVIGPIPMGMEADNTIKMKYSDEKITLEDLSKEFSNHIFIFGKSNHQIENILLQKDKTTKIIDILEIEEFTILNIIPTIEGAIQVAIKETKRTLHGSNVLILGFGRIGKLLSKSLAGLGVNVSCEARKNEDLAWIKAYGYNEIHLKDLKKEIGKFDIIFNTIPVEIINQEILEKVKKETLIIELASLPGGIDRKAASKQGIKVVEALALPGKIAPETVAQYIYNVIINI